MHIQASVALIGEQHTSRLLPMRAHEQGSRMVRWAADRWHSIWHVGLPPRSVAAFVFSAVAVAIATALRIGLGAISPDSAIFAPYYSATLVSALVGGAEAGIAAAALGGLTACWLFIPEEWALAPFRLEQVVSFVLYGTSSVVIICAAQSYRGLLERLRAEQAARQLLNLELVHRIKNMLASVQAIVSQSVRNQDDALETVSARLAALGATNDLLVKSELQNAPLREILGREFAPYDLSRFDIRGDEVELPYAVAVAMALVVHELTTNAVKHGALSGAHGRVAITCRRIRDRLVLEWVESGGPEPALPTREGFGTKLLRAGLRQFQGNVDCRFEPSGLRCRLSLMLPGKPEREPDKAAARTARQREQAPIKRMILTDGYPGAGAIES